MSSVILGLIGMVLGWVLMRSVLKRRRQRAVDRIICEHMTEWEQRREAWRPREGDGIRPLKKRA